MSKLSSSFKGMSSSRQYSSVGAVQESMREEAAHTAGDSEHLVNILAYRN